MESSWDIVFACKTDMLNQHIREQQIAFMDNFRYKGDVLSASIPQFSIGWAGNEQYMSVDLTLRNVTINFGGITEFHETVYSRVQLQFCFKDQENVGFACKTMAEHQGDITFGAVWVVNGDLTGVIQNEDLQDAFGSLLGKALIENEEKIGVVLANLKKEFFQPLGITIVKSVPAFQNLDGVPVMAVMCLTKEQQTEPSRQFSPELLMGYDYGYILRKEIFLEKLVLPHMKELINVDSGRFKMYDRTSIINDGNVIMKTISVAGTHYTIEAGLLKLQFLGDNLHLLVEGSADFTGLADSYISYSFHAVRQPSFTSEDGGRISFVILSERPDEYHSDKHIPLWIEITAGIFTFGLFTMISEIFYDEIQSQVKNMMNGIKYNAKDGGYFLTWSNMRMKFTDGNFAGDFYMRGNR